MNSFWMIVLLLAIGVACHLICQTVMVAVDVLRDLRALVTRQGEVMESIEGRVRSIEGSVEDIAAQIQELTGVTTRQANLNAIERINKPLRDAAEKWEAEGRPLGDDPAGK